LVEITIHVDTILYLSLYYSVKDLVHLPNPTITNLETNTPLLIVVSGVVELDEFNK